MNKVRMGVIGLGNMGTTHVKSILENKIPGMELGAVADRSEMRRSWAAGILPIGFPIYSEGIDLITSGKADAVLIATPHYQHPSLGIEAMKNKLHVMCEKPAGVYTKQVREINEFAAERKDLVYGMMFNQRTNCVFRKMHELIQSGSMGAIKRVNWIITDWYRTQRIRTPRGTFRRNRARQ